MFDDVGRGLVGEIGRDERWGRWKILSGEGRNTSRVEGKMDGLRRIGDMM